MNDELRARLQEIVETALYCREGLFYPDKDFGIKLSLASMGKNISKILAYAQCALSDIDGLYIKSARVHDENIVFKIRMNDEEGEVMVKL